MDVVGLSPRVRGNPIIRPLKLVIPRSIPASAGEPRTMLLSHRRSWVYPRECGGTCRRGLRTPAVGGLSPRVRGNRTPARDSIPGTRSIPASAGEPKQSHGVRRRTKVYPRECGGTIIRGRQRAPGEGLSPRVRGNRRSPATMAGLKRSIPASAGEPTEPLLIVSAPGVYPRECGGTEVSEKLAIPFEGLSPRVRGNPACQSSADTNKRSIPASAGEPYNEL